MKCNICAMEKNHVTSVCLQQCADTTVAGQPGGRSPTPGLQAGMVAMEERVVRNRGEYSYEIYEIIS